MIRRILLVISLVLLVGTAGVWVRSYWARMEIHWSDGDGADYRAACNYGAAQMWVFRSRSRRSPRLPRGIFSFSGKASPIDKYGLTHFKHLKCEPYVDWPGINSVSVPLWLPTAVLSITSCVLARPLVRTWRRRRYNLCLTCGYDLTGNVSGVCPECGTIAAGVPVGRTACEAQAATNSRG